MSEPNTCSACGYTYPEDVQDGDSCDSCGEPFIEDSDLDGEDLAADDVEDDDE